MDRQTQTQIEELKAMREAYRQHAYHTIVAEQIGESSLSVLHPKKTLLQKILRR